MNELDEPIAIIGMAGRFPGSDDIDQFWRNLAEGRESVHLATDEELRASGVPAEALADPAYVRAVAVAPDIDRFDATFFGVTPREADLCDPQIKLFLESAHAAMENSGYDPTRVTDVGVFGSAGVNRYLDLSVRADRSSVRSATGMSMGMLSNSDYVATLVSYKYDFRGPSMTVQTACSSSMVAVALAGQALRAGQCQLAIAGGADVEFPFAHGHWWAPGSPLTRDGHCRPFDSRATGTIFGSGVGVVVLKRLSDALADGDHVRAIVRTMAVNNDGSEKVGFSAPGISGQAAVIAEAMAVADIDPALVSYVEAHSTGTVLGDPIEVAALDRAYRQTTAAELEPGGCLLGSVKGNVGHLGHAAGVTSLIKVVLSLENELIPPSINFEEPNPKLELDGSPFAVADRARPWPRVPGRPRLAGVNSLGIGGTNVHSVIEEAPAAIRTAPDGRPRVVVWSAKSTEAARSYRARLSAHFAGTAEDAFADTVATLQRGRTAHSVRAAAVAATAAEAAVALTGDRPAVVVGDGARRPPVFLFPGQGSQHIGMAADLYATDGEFATALDDCFDLFAAHGLPVGDTLRSATADEDLEPTVVAQPLLFAIEHTLATMWSSWGVEPTAVLGHSIGELAAATVAGVFDLPDAIALVAARAEAMRAAPGGAMLAVTAGVDDVTALLTEGVTVAVVNGPHQTVVAGSADALESFQGTLAEHGVWGRRVRTSHAFHSPALAVAVEPFARAFGGIVTHPARIPVISTATGRQLTDEEAASPAFWAGQLVAPVLFSDALEHLLAGSERLLIEVGPGRALTSLVKQHPTFTAGRHLVVPTLPRQRTDDQAERTSVLAAVAAMWADGHEVDWAAVDRHAPLRRLPVPGYPYQRVRHWIDAVAEPAPDAAPADTAAGDTAATPSTTPVTPATPATATGTAGDAPATALSTIGWAEQDVTGDDPKEPGAHSALVLLPADRERALDTVAALHQAGLRVLAVRPGERYQETGADFQVRPGEADDLARVFRALADRGNHPELLVHAVALGDWDRPTAATVADQLENTFYSLLALAQQGARRSGDGRLPSLLVLTDRSVDVSGGELVDPVKASMHGLVRTLAVEQPGTTAKLVDAGPGVAEDDLVAELRRWQASEVVALRGERRWTQVERPFTPHASGRSALRRHGVYLITGGLGGLGRTVARELAATGLRPRVILLGRTATTTERDGFVDELAALGARVRVQACDVTDPRALRRAIDIATATFGALNGVLHLAGVAGDGMVQFLDRARAATVLAPKVLGTLVLHEALVGRPSLDFVVSFSSRASIGGLVGGGDYAAANAFLDAYARERRSDDCRVLAVNWPAWASVGMAAAGLSSGVPAQGPTVGAGPAEHPSGTPDHEWGITLRPADCPVLDEHRLGGTPVLPGTGHLDLVVRAFRDRVLGSAKTSVRLADVVFQRPLAVPDECRTRIALTRDGEWWRFTVASASAAGPTVHVIGRIAEAAPEPRHADVDGLLHALSERRDPPARPGAWRLFALGPRWDNVEAVHERPGDRSERAVSLVLPAAFAAEVDKHALHPTLLDSATSYARDPEREAPHLPFLYRSMVVHAPLPARLTSHIRRRDAADDMIVADVDLIGPDGRILVEITGFTMRRVREDVSVFAETVRGTASHEPATPEAGSHRDSTHPTSAHPTSTHSADTPEAGIPPEAGGRLLLQLLAARTPRQVAVRLFRNGLPVPVPVAQSVPTAVPVRIASAVPMAGDPGPWPAPAQQSASAAGPQRATAAEEAAGGQDGGESVDDRLRALWTAALGIAVIGAEDDFFDLGGNSLTAVELMSQIQKRFQVELSIAALFDFPTLASLAQELRRLGAR